jgi:thioredoxin reductase
LDANRALWFAPVGGPVRISVLTKEGLTVNSRVPQPGYVETAVIGGGAAGLAAANMLGRMRRDVIVLDAGRTRNRFAEHVHGYIARDGFTPAEFRDAALRALSTYGNVTVSSDYVTEVHQGAGVFIMRTRNGAHIACRKMLLATGTEDVLPAVDGLSDVWGKGLYACLYCHGWECRDQSVAVIGGTHPGSISLALHIRALSGEVTLIMDRLPSTDEVRLLHRFDVHWKLAELTHLARAGENAVSMTMADGAEYRFGSAFVISEKLVRSDLAKEMGCELNYDGKVKVNSFYHSSVRGIYAAGDVAAGSMMVSQVLAASAEGAQAGIAIDQDLFAWEVDMAAKEPAGSEDPPTAPRFAIPKGLRPLVERR